MKLVRLPRLGVNDDSSVVHWDVPPGARVLPGQRIAALETTKATYDLLAEVEGVLSYHLATGTSAEVGAAVAVIAASQVAGEALVRALAPAPASPASVGASERKVSARARLLAEAHGVDLASLGGTGPIKEEDVRAHLEKRTPQAGTPGDLVDDAYPGRLPRLVLIGAGRAAVQILDVATRAGQHRIVGLYDDNPALAGKRVMGFPVLGTISRDVVEAFAARRFDCAVIAIGSPLALRQTLFARLKAAGIPLANVIDPSAYVSGLARVGEGNVILPHCHVTACATVGDNNFLSAYTSIEHHSVLGSHCTFGPGVMFSGGVQVGDLVQFGTGIFIEPRIEIGSGSVVASGAVLVGHVPPRTLVKTKVSAQLVPLDATPRDPD